MANRMLSSVIILAIILCTGIIIAKEKFDLPDHPERGIEIFKKKNCIKCHSVWGKEEKIGPDLSGAIKDKDFYQIIGLLWNHAPSMFMRMKQEGIKIEEMTPDDMRYLIAYLYYLNFFDPPGNFEQGEKLFNDKNCIKCHSVGREGEKAGPSLDKFGRMISPVYLGTDLWNHRSVMEKMFNTKNIEFPVFDKKDLADIAVFIRGKAVDETENRKYLETGSPNKGRTVFEEKKCGECHAIFGVGGNLAPDLGKAKLSRVISEIIAILLNHQENMEMMYKEMKLELPKFKAQEMADLLTFLYFNNFYNEKGDTLKGGEVFRSKGCITCHSISGEGEAKAPDLAYSDIDFESFEFAARIWNHTQVMNEEIEKEVLAWPTFKEDEMRHLIFYLKSKVKR